MFDPLGRRTKYVVENVERQANYDYLTQKELLISTKTQLLRVVIEQSNSTICPDKRSLIRKGGYFGFFVAAPANASQVGLQPDL